MNIYEEKVCTNCGNNNCTHRIKEVQKDNETIIKCEDFISKNSRKKTPRNWQEWQGAMFKFKINNTEWSIKEVSEAEINNEMKNDYTMGVTIYKTQEVLLLKEQANIIKTLKHELIHVWLYEYGHRQDDDKKYDYEDICEIVASSNDFINEIVEQYKSNKKIKHIDVELDRTNQPSITLLNQEIEQA